MCGLAGILGPGRADREVLRAMSACVAHRGPDAEGTWVDPAADVGLTHRRLAVLGLGPTGAQPMTSVAGRFVLVLNGEIYNHLELRERLHREGRAPAWCGGSDTESLLAAVEAWGVRTALTRSDGMFALALWDARDRTLTLARDRMGEKPLSYAVHRGALLFASQPSALLAAPGFDPPIDRDALGDLLRFAQVPGDRGIHAGVRKVPPGTLLTVPAADPTRTGDAVAWWSLLEVARRGVADPLRGGEPERVEAVASAVREAVRAQLISDVPLGAFLSGGVDSSLVVAMMQEVGAGPARTFTIGFAEQDHDEAPYARAIARHLGTDHTELVLSGSDALDMIPELPAIYDEPFADSSQIPTVLVSRLARRSVTVALSGDGGDELFAGYTRYLQAERLAGLPQAVGPIAEHVFRLLGRRRRSSLGAALRAGEWAIVRRLLSANPEGERLVRGLDPSDGTARFRAAWDRTAGLGDLTARSMALDACGYLPDDILHKVDRAAMSVALETRVPLLDHRLVELAWRLPSEDRVREGRGKWILREVLARHVPRDLFERPKQGFGIPVSAWLRGPLRAWGDGLLDPIALASDGLLDPGPVRALWDEHQSGRADAGYELWPVLMFRAWQEAGAGRRAS